MYQKCPVCRSKGILKNGEQCPTCSGERIIHKENGLPPSRQPSPFCTPYVPVYPYYPHYPWWYTTVSGSITTAGGSDTGTTETVDNSYNAIYTSTLN